MTKFKAVHFDLDGVIADSEHLHQEAEEQTCLDHGIKVDSSVWGGKLKGKTSEDIFAYMIEHYGDPGKYDPKDLVEYKSDIFIKIAKKELKTIDGVREFIEWVRGKYDKISLVTWSDEKIQKFVTEYLGIDHIFDAIINGDDITEGKPSPQPYEKVLKKLGLDGGDSLVIEDSVNGIRSAKAAGCSVLAMATSHTPEELLFENPDFIAENYPHAKQLLLTNA